MTPRTFTRTTIARGIDGGSFAIEWPSHLAPRDTAERMTAPTRGAWDRLAAMVAADVAPLTRNP